MKNPLIIFLVVLSQSCNEKTALLISGVTNENLKAELDSTYLFKSNPKEGFNFDYYLFVPKGVDTSKENAIIVESTNTGLSDSIEYHMKGAKYAASKSSVGNFVSRKLKIPLLVPVFPRSQTNWEVYSHAFDNETFNIKNDKLEGLDIQLLAMIENAKRELNKMGFRTRDRFLLTGFSASGTFANRFAILHPEKIQAVAAGGVNSILILPVDQLNGKSLNFPLGINDIEAVTGKKVDLDGYRNLPQFWFMGETDDNDAVQFDDAYSAQERKLVFSLLGVEMQERWQKVEMIYRASNIPAIFKTYEGIGHGTDLKINNEISDFFAKYSNN